MGSQSLDGAQAAARPQTAQAVPSRASSVSPQPPPPSPASPVPLGELEQHKLASPVAQLRAEAAQSCCQPWAAPASPSLRTDRVMFGQAINRSLLNMWKICFHRPTRKCSECCGVRSGEGMAGAARMGLACVHASTPSPHLCALLLPLCWSISCLEGGNTQQGRMHSPLPPSGLWGSHPAHHTPVTPIKTTPPCWAQGHQCDRHSQQHLQVPSGTVTSD